MTPLIGAATYADLGKEHITFDTSQGALMRDFSLYSRVEACVDRSASLEALG